MSDLSVKELQAQYREMLDSQRFDESLLDKSLLERRIGEMTHFSQMTNSLVTLYDHFRKGHVYASANHKDIIGIEAEYGLTRLSGKADKLHNINYSLMLGYRFGVR